MKTGILVLSAILGPILWPSGADAQNVVVHQGAVPADYCDTRKTLAMDFNGTEGRHLFWESYSHTADMPLYVAVEGSRIDIFPNGTTLSCVEAGSWKRLSEVVPNDGEEAITYLGDCAVSVPSKPHKFQIAFTPRYGDVTEEGSRTYRKLVRTFSKGSFSERTLSLANYRVDNYRALYTSCLELTVR